MPMGPDYNDVQLNPDVIENMFGMNPGRQMAFGTANEGFGFTVMSYLFIFITEIRVNLLVYKFNYFVFVCFLPTAFKILKFKIPLKI